MKKAYIIYDEEFNIMGILSDSEYKNIEDLNKAIDDYLHVPDTEDFWDQWYEVEEFNLFNTFKDLHDLKKEKEKCKPNSEKSN